ncbi:MAG: hypothetical protein K8H90_07770 [Thermoanaerobaculia bacterium]|nr:hypothetical protein [Thermoanaerobaculia bacterium]
MKKLVSCFAVASLLALGSSAIADLCTIEATPAATLLLPYFEVDIADPNGVDTFFSINNASAATTLTHVIVWTDMSVEALDFNVYLTGYDVQTIAMGMMIRDGILPRTDNSNSVSPLGPYSDGHISYPNCGVMPYTNPALDPAYIDHVQSLLTGGPSAIYGGRCGGYPYGDNIARGYVTVDVTSDCTLRTPCEDGYFFSGVTPYEGVGEYANILWGDWYIINYAENFAQGDTLVHIEAVDPADQIGQETLNGTFWGRCSGDTDLWGTVGWAEPWYDLRETLPTTFATRFYQNEAFQGGTDLLVWRDSVVQLYFEDYFSGYGDMGIAGFDCSVGPMWYAVTGGLPQRQTVVFDEQENPEALCTISPCPEADVLFPLETQRASIPDLDVTPQSGWLYANLNMPDLYTCDGQDCTLMAQSWMTAIHSAEGRFSAGLPAIQLDNYCDNRSVTLGEDGPFVDPAVYNFFTYYVYYYYGDQSRTPAAGTELHPRIQAPIN